jgi:ribose transport system substrate-binding protein
MKTRSPPRCRSSSRQTSIDRVLRILARLEASAAAVRLPEFVAALDIPRSSAYATLRQLVDQGYVEQLGQCVRVGARWVPIVLAFQRQHQDDLTEDKEESNGAGAIYQVPRTYLWNPELTEMIDCRGFRRQPPYSLAFSNASTNNPWRIALLHSIERCAEENAEKLSRLQILDATDDPVRQARDIDALVSQRPDLLLVSCSEAEPLEAAVSRAHAVGIPVVVVDRRPSGVGFVSHVSASNIAMGRIMAQWLVEKLNGTGTIFMLAGRRGSSPAERRVAAAMEVFAQYPALTVAGLRYTSWLANEGQAAIRDMIQTHGIPGGVWCDSGLQGSGSMQAFLDHGLPSDEVPIHTGGDVNRAFQLATQHNIPLASVEYPAAMGGRSLRIGLDVLGGKMVPRIVEVDATVVVSRGHETRSVRADVFVEDYVRWDRPAEFVVSHGLGSDYDPESFMATYPK